MKNKSVKKSIMIMPAAVVLAGTLFFALSFSVQGIAEGTAKPGSNDDPLVTKSYVDEKIKQLETAASSDPFPFDKVQNQNETQESAVKIIFTPVLINAGESIIGHEGTELILRSGEAYAVVSGTNGLSDITEGIDLLNGEKIPENHLLVVPRDDGRGFLAKTDVWVLAKGGFDILK